MLVVMKAKPFSITIFLVIVLILPITIANAQEPTIFLNTSFEDEPSPQKCAWNGYTPKGFSGDIGDGETKDPDIAVMWVIDSNDDPALGRLPPSFIDGSKVIYGKVKPDPEWSTEDFLMHVMSETQDFYISWYQMFDPLPLGTSDWLPIFWDFVRKKDLTGTVTQYTVPAIKAILVGDSIEIVTDQDAHINLTGATTTPYTIKPLTWYKFEFWHRLNEVNGEVTFKINNETVFSFTGDTVPKTLDPNYVYTKIHGFEVGLQMPGLNTPNNYTYWLDKIITGNYVIPEFPTGLLLPIKLFF